MQQANSLLPEAKSRDFTLIKLCKYIFLGVWKGLLQMKSLKINSIIKMSRQELEFCKKNKTLEKELQTVTYGN